MVSLMKKHVGRGPTTARAFINDGVVTIVLEDTHTEVERTLVGAGKPEVVKELRLAYQEALCADAVKLIEETMSAEVRAFMADHAVEADVTVLCFLLARDEREAQEAGSPCDEIESSETLG